MEAQQGTQQLHLALAHKLFLLSHPDIDDIEKVRLRDEVLDAVKAHGNDDVCDERSSYALSELVSFPSFFRSRPRIDDELKKLDEK
ncbi:hypothetical protein BHE74_00005747 [Ensete ventricosum]|nr:hypothetical protein GW17_00014846 [Ensete ventricosum]RWW85557.1 hypothetical protein BHE74_00005747 [Ensete ventricosum]